MSNNMIVSLIHLIKCIQNSHPQYHLLYNTQQVSQASVAIILEIPNSFQSTIKFLNELNSYSERIENQQIMALKFLQNEAILIEQHRLNHNPQHELEVNVIVIKRKADPMNPHSGQLAFPGGMLTASENDFIAAIRETNEEIGINLQKDSFSLGRLPTNYYAYPTKQSKDLYIAANIFLLPRALTQAELRLDQREVAGVLHFSLNDLFSMKYRLKTFLEPTHPKITEQMTKFKILNSLLTKNFKHLETPYCEFQDQKFYGLSWLILMNIVSKMNYANNTALKEVVEQTRVKYKFTFEPKSHMRQILFQQMYHKTRLNQFYV